MKEILEFGLFIFVICSPVIMFWLMNEISNIIAYKMNNKKKK